MHAQRQETWCVYHNYYSALHRAYRLQTAEEQAFVYSLMQTSKEIHEQELVAKGNELRRVRSGIPSYVLSLMITLIERQFDQTTCGANCFIGGEPCRILE